MVLFLIILFSIIEYKSGLSVGGVLFDVFVKKVKIGHYIVVLGALRCSRIETTRDAEGVSLFSLTHQGIGGQAPVHLCA